LSAGAFAAGVVLTPVLASAATINVTTPDDELNADGDCSLREAVEAANGDAAVDACAAGAGDDVIELAGAQTYALSLAGAGEDANASGDLDLLSNITIRSAADAAIIDAAGIDRVLDVATGASVQLHNLEITGVLV
jgi:CSLREA domain-containing protein